jgi:dienelactone hydrolase
MVYTHDLDRDTLALDGGPMKRLDLQLVAMIKHAQGLFKDNGVPVKQKVLMTGFSASAKFATKFAALHPDVVHALSAGGVNGVSILPVSSLKNRVLRYPVGVSDMKELTGEPFDVESYKKVRQFIFMGAKDTNDITEFRDAFDEVDAQLTWDVLGRDMLGVRWPAYQKVLKDVGAAVQFHTYSGIGHQFTNVTMDDQVKFFKANMGETFKVIVPNVKGI